MGKIPFSDNLISLILIFFPLASYFTVYRALSHTLTWPSWKLFQEEEQGEESFPFYQLAYWASDGRHDVSKILKPGLTPGFLTPKPALSPSEHVVPNSHLSWFRILQSLDCVASSLHSHHSHHRPLLLIISSLSSSSLWISSVIHQKTSPSSVSNHL